MNNGERIASEKLENTLSDIERMIRNSMRNMESAKSNYSSKLREVSEHIVFQGVWNIDCLIDDMRKCKDTIERYKIKSDILNDIKNYLLGDGNSEGGNNV